jgi:hypothetical protein
MTSGSGYGYGMPPASRWTSGRWMTGSEYSRMRACDADRERTADLLRTAFVEGRLSQDELDERLGRVYTSRTYADLATQTADLPLPPTRQRMPAPRSYAPPSTNGLAVGAFVCGLLEVVTFGLTAIPAIVLGHNARRQIRRTGEHGDGLALTGLLLGWLGVAVFALLVIALIAFTATGHGQVIHARPGAGG